MHLSWRALIAACSVATPAGASELEARVDVYADQQIVVVAPAARTTVDLDPSSTLSGGLVVNTVSGATLALVDAVSSATRFTSRRLAWDLAASRQLTRGLRLTGGAGASLEEDFAAHSLLVGVVGDLPGEMTRLTADLRLRAERVSPSGGDPRVDHGAGQDLELSWVQLLGRTTRATLLVSGFLQQCGPHWGCGGSPYRYVSVGADEPLALSERHPRRRGRAAIGVRLSQALGRGLAVHGGYRLYVDTWAIHAHTADLSVAASLLGERLLLRGFGRFTWQAPASFAGRAELADGLRTGDREIGGLWDLQVGGRIELGLFAVGPWTRLAPSLRVTHGTWRYRYGGVWPRRDAWVIGGGVDADF